MQPKLPVLVAIMVSIQKHSFLKKRIENRCHKKHIILGALSLKKNLFQCNLWRSLLINTISVHSILALLNYMNTENYWFNNKRIYRNWKPLWSTVTEHNSFILRYLLYLLNDNVHNGLGIYITRLCFRTSYYSYSIGYMSG